MIIFYNFIKEYINLIIKQNLFLDNKLKYKIILKEEQIRFCNLLSFYKHNEYTKYIDKLRRINQ